MAYWYDEALKGGEAEDDAKKKVLDRAEEELRGKPLGTVLKNSDLPNILPEGLVDLMVRYNREARNPAGHHRSLLEDDSPWQRAEIELPMRPGEPLVTNDVYLQNALAGNGLLLALYDQISTLSYAGEISRIWAVVRY